MVDGDRISRVEVKPRLAGRDCTTLKSDGELSLCCVLRSGEPCSDPAGIAARLHAKGDAETADADAILCEGNELVSKCSAAILQQAHYLAQGNLLRPASPTALAQQRHRVREAPRGARNSVGRRSIGS